MISPVTRLLLMITEFWVFRHNPKVSDRMSWPAQAVRLVRLWPDHFFLKEGVPRARALY